MDTRGKWQKPCRSWIWYEGYVGTASQAGIAFHVFCSWQRAANRTDSVKHNSSFCRSTKPTESKRPNFPSNHLGFSGEMNHHKSMSVPWGHGAMIYSRIIQSFPSSSSKLSLNKQCMLPGTVNAILDVPCDFMRTSNDLKPFPSDSTFGRPVAGGTRKPIFFSLLRIPFALIWWHWPFDI